MIHSGYVHVTDSIGLMYTVRGPTTLTPALVFDESTLIMMFAYHIRAGIGPCPITILSVDHQVRRPAVIRTFIFTADLRRALVVHLVI